MKSFSAFLTFCALLACSGESAEAQSIGNYTDWAYDYEVYITDYETAWFTVVTWTDGSVSEYRYTTYESAQDFAIWLYLHIVEVDEIDIVPRAVLGEWEYVGTCGTYSQAVAEADGWEYDGYETDIRAVKVNTIELSPKLPIRKLAPKITPTLPPIK
jgi:hypothetical protein